MIDLEGLVTVKASETVPPPPLEIPESEVTMEASTLEISEEDSFVLEEEKPPGDVPSLLPFDGGEPESGEFQPTDFSNPLA